MDFSYTKPTVEEKIYMIDLIYDQEIKEAEIDRQIKQEKEERILGDDVIEELKQETPAKKTVMEIMLGNDYKVFFK